MLTSMFGRKHEPDFNPRCHKTFIDVTGEAPRDNHAKKNGASKGAVFI